MWTIALISHAGAASSNSLVLASGGSKSACEKVAAGWGAAGGSACTGCGETSERGVVSMGAGSGTATGNAGGRPELDARDESGCDIDDSLRSGGAISTVGVRRAPSHAGRGPCTCSVYPSTLLSARKPKRGNPLRRFFPCTKPRAHGASKRVEQESRTSNDVSWSIRT
jgi:hypothetical protein